MTSGGYGRPLAVFVVVACVVAGFGILFGFALLVVPGVFLTVRLRLVTAAVILEDSGPLEALGRSFDLTSTHPRTVFGVLATLVTGPVVPVADAVMYRLYGPDARDDRAR